MRQLILLIVVTAILGIFYYMFTCKKSPSDIKVEWDDSGFPLGVIPLKDGIINPEEGFCISPEVDSLGRHTIFVYSKANKLWEVFVSFSRELMPDICIPALSVPDSALPESDRSKIVRDKSRQLDGGQFLIYGSPILKEKIIETFSKFQFQLINDGEVGFGILPSNLEVSSTEIIVTDDKYIEIHTAKKDLTIEILTKCGLSIKNQLKAVYTGIHMHAALSVLRTNKKVKELGNMSDYTVYTKRIIQNLDLK